MNPPNEPRQPPSLVPLKKTTADASQRSADEQATVELLKRVGEPATLSPEAYSRIGRRLREPKRRRLPLLADMRLALLAGGVAAVAIIAALSFSMFDHKAAPRSAEDATLARADLPAAAPTGADAPVAMDESGRVVAEPAPAFPAEAPSALPPSALQGALEAQSKSAMSERRFAAPPPTTVALRGGNDAFLGTKGGDSIGTGAKAGGRLSQAGRGYATAKTADKDEAAAPTDPWAASPEASISKSQAFADKDDAEGAPPPPPAPQRAKKALGAPHATANKATEETADYLLSPFGSAGAGAPATAAAPSSAPVPTDGCWNRFPEVPVDDLTDTSAEQRALLGRAKCHLSAGRRDLGIDELRAYLQRFPAGDFVDEARRLMH